MCSSRPGQALAGRLPARLGLLHVVLAEDPLARGERGLDPLLGLRLGDRDQRHRRGVAADRARRGGDALAHRAQMVGDAARDGGLFGLAGHARFLVLALR